MINILFRIVMPLIIPDILVSAILTFINSWGAFLIPLVLDANPADTPGAVGIYQFMSANGQVQFGQLAAYSVLFSRARDHPLSDQLPLAQRRLLLRRAE